MIRIAVIVALMLGAAGAHAQDAARGHWTGTVELPNGSLGMEVDLDKTPQGWIGSISIPAQNASGLPLGDITVAESKCTFRIMVGADKPTFTGAISADGKTMSGEFTQGPAEFPFKFARTGEPKVVAQMPSRPVAPEFVGTWEGTLEAGQSLRLVLTISNGDSGAKAMLVSVDQGGAEIPVSEIVQAESKLTLKVSAVGGRYEGEINKTGNELTGTWSQGGNDLPLKFTKKTAAK